jgi:hypothetical protein
VVSTFTLGAFPRIALSGEVGNWTGVHQTNTADGQVIFSGADCTILRYAEQESHVGTRAAMIRRIKSIIASNAWSLLAMREPCLSHVHSVIQRKHGVMLTCEAIEEVLKIPFRLNLVRPC